MKVNAWSVCDLNRAVVVDRIVQFPRDSSNVFFIEHVEVIADAGEVATRILVEVFARVYFEIDGGLNLGIRGSKQWAQSVLVFTVNYQLLFFIIFLKFEIFYFLV